MLSVSGTVTHVSCFGGADGAIDITVSGGTPGYTYAWSNFSTSQDQNAIPAGIYSVTVTDANGCTAVGSWVVTQPSQLSVSTATSDESAIGASDGSATAAASGGTPPYSYAWSNGGATSTISNLTSGTYTVTATDANGCTVEGTAIVSLFLACATPGGLGASNIKPFSAVLVWDTVAGANKYIIRGGAVGSPNAITIVIPNGSTGQKAV
ncbi:MAG TPA: hypothetical protein EYO59_09240, partial [Chromatiaceae bacterium]|nr:hypothetical protein [Chromatiaceae bacterium]